MNLPTNKEEIEGLIRVQVQESLYLDYKDSRAITEKKRAEIAKDVSAFANSDGGLLIYGVEEKDHLPVRIDQGIAHSSKFSREWLENVITSGIAPRIEDIQIAQIPISETHSIFAVKVPKSFRGPHQERLESKKYYRRFNFKSEAMEDYEIKEAWNRRRLAPPLVNVNIEVKRNLAEFVVSNPGDVTAQDLQFEFSEGLKWMQELKPTNILTKGIRNLPPGRVSRFVYNEYIKLLETCSDASKRFKVCVSYFHPELNQRTRETFDFDLTDFAQTIVDESDIERMTKKLVTDSPYAAALSCKHLSS